MTILLPSRFLTKICIGDTNDPSMVSHKPFMELKYSLKWRYWRCHFKLWLTGTYVAYQVAVVVRPIHNVNLVINRPHLWVFLVATAD